MNHTRDHICVCNFSPDEEEVLRFIASRIEKARPQYGPLNIDTDKRDFEDEAHCEDVDAIVYRTITTIKRRRRRSKPLAQQPDPKDKG